MTAMILTSLMTAIRRLISAAPILTSSMTAKRRTSAVGSAAAALTSSMRTSGRRRGLVSAAVILVPILTTLLMLCLLLANAQSISKKQPGSGGEYDDGAALTHHLVTPESLPAPDMSKPGVSFQKVVPLPEGASLRVPTGFQVTTFADGGFQVPRWMALAPNGDVFLADSRAGDVIVVRDGKQAGVADQRFTFAVALTMPFGLAFWHEYLYVGDTDAVLRFRYRPGRTKADGPPEKIAGLPGRGNHWTRSVLFNPAGERPDLVARAIVPDVLIQAHSAILGLLFYQGSMFPQEFRGDAFVALHGSWNRSVPTGYKIIRIHFNKGRPVGGYDDFITGWMVNENGIKVWGRPVGLLELKDGSMLIADDGGKKIWRVTYTHSDVKR